MSTAHGTRRCQQFFQRGRRCLFHARSRLSGRIMKPCPPKSVVFPTSFFIMYPNHVYLASRKTRPARSKPGRTQKYALGAQPLRNYRSEHHPSASAEYSANLDTASLSGAVASIRRPCLALPLGLKRSLLGLHATKKTTLPRCFTILRHRWCHCHTFRRASALDIALHVPF